MLIVNPHATSTTPLRMDVIARALASELDLKVVQTRYRGHAEHFAGEAAKEGYGLVITLGGDGTVNEAVNGLLRACPPAAGDAGARPALAAVPGGNANVFTRALGMPPDPVDATGRILATLTQGRCRTIGIGLADDRYFTFNAGLGLDAEVVRAIEGLRADGQDARAGLYLWTAFRHFYGVTNRRRAVLTLERDGCPPGRPFVLRLHLQYRPLDLPGQPGCQPQPGAGFDTGLDVFATRTMATVPTLNVLRQMFALRRAGSPGSKHVLSLHDLAEFEFRAARPIAFQVDGEYVGERERVWFQSVPGALRVLA